MNDFFTNFTSEYLTKENLTFLLSIIGSIGTVAGWLCHWFETRKNLTFKLIGYQWNQQGLLMYYHLTNNSLQSIAINDISFKYNSNEYHCSPIPVKVLETTRRIGREVVDRKEFYSTQFPLNLSPLCGNSGYLNFSFDPEIQQPAPSSLTFVIRTNRGKALKKKLPLNKILD